MAKKFNTVMPRVDSLVLETWWGRIIPWIILEERGK